MEPKKEATSKAELNVINTKRNPYLVDYKQERKRQESQQQNRRQWNNRSQEGGQGKARRTDAVIRKSIGGSTNVEGRTNGRRDNRTVRRRRRLEHQIRLRRRLAKYLAIACIALLFFSLIKHYAGTKETSTAVASSAENGEDTPIKLDEGKIQGLPATDYEKHPEWTEDFLTPNEYSRPGDSLEEVSSIFVHYTANPGTSAAQNRSYFEQLKDNHERSASAHFIIGYEGEIIQCIPLDEIAYAVQTRNYDSLSIECCYLAEDGSFTQETYDSLIELLKWLTDVYDLDEDDILRHYDCGGKKCPLYYTEHEDAWKQLKRDVMD